MTGIKQKIEEANRKTIDILIAGQPIWVGCKPAIEVIPNMSKTTILHAGPPILWVNMCQPMKNGIMGALLFEGLADDKDEAEKLAVSGNITIAPCHDYQSVGGMTGITSPSTPVHVVKNGTNGNFAYCGFHEGTSPNGLGWGTYDQESLNHLNWMRDELAPVLDACLKASGGINMKQIISRAIQMGDECHGHCGAATSLITRELAPYISKMNIDKEVVNRAFEFLRITDIFALHVIMAAARSIVEPSKNIPFSTILTTIARNGVEIGIKVSSMGDEWFIGEAQKIESVFFSPEWSEDDAAPDIGDSSIVETVGLGGLIAAASPAQEFALGGNSSSAKKRTEEAYSFCAGEHTSWTIPDLDFRGAPLGIDVRKVISTGFTPTMDTATAHKEGGKIGIGISRVPIEVFEKALRAFSKKQKGGEIK